MPRILIHQQLDSTQSVSQIRILGLNHRHRLNATRRIWGERCLQKSVTFPFANRRYRECANNCDCGIVANHLTIKIMRVAQGSQNQIEFDSGVSLYAVSHLLPGTVVHSRQWCCCTKTTSSPTLHAHGFTSVVGQIHQGGVLEFSGCKDEAGG